MSPRTLEEETREALRHQRAGELGKAREAWTRILARHPRHAPACNGLALIRLAEGQADESLRLLEIAMAERPESAIYRNNLGNALRDLGRLDEAERAYHEALRLDERYANARFNLAQLVLARGRTAEGRSQLEALLARHPDFAPGYVALASLLSRSAGGASAETCLRRGLRALPSAHELWLELGALLRIQGRTAEAIACLERSVVLQPDRATTHNDLGALHQIVGRVEPALACFDRALELEPELGHAHFNRGKLLEDLSRFDEARDALGRAMKLDAGLATESACHLAVVRRHLCDWRDEDAKTADLIGRIETLLETRPDRGLPPLTLNVVAVPPETRLAVARHLARGVEAETRAVTRRAPFAHERRPEPERLRIGYVSPDFRIHAVGSLIHDLFRHHDRRAVEVFAYSLVDVDDAFSRSIRAGVDRFVDVSRTPAGEIAQRIHADRIDVLVDVAGYTTYSRTGVFALRPAPVQMHWLGYLDTMGADFLPYLLADETVIPDDAIAGYSETIVSLPHGFAVASPLPIAATPTRAALGLPDEAFVFCCMNGLHKIDREVFETWMRILARVPDSILWLADEGSATARANLAREAEARGIASTRLRFAPRAPLPEYLARYRAADLFLDTFAYNAGATAVGALRAGLPVLTRPGRNFMSRMGASLCRAARLDEMVCVDPTTYVERAVELASDRAQLASVRAKLARAQAAPPNPTTNAPGTNAAPRDARETLAPLFDPAGFARQLEAAFSAAWRHHATGSRERRIRLPG